LALRRACRVSSARKQRTRNARTPQNTAMFLKRDAGAAAATSAAMARERALVGGR
jgi:hypothetical protein